MSPKASPLLGYNNNVRHKGHVFHIQTEDSGVRYGHIITHLFMDGGRILKSVKTSYSEHVASERRTEIVRAMMKEQHKAMFVALREGMFDSFVDGATPDQGAIAGRGKANEAAVASARPEGRTSARPSTAAGSAQVTPLRPAALRSAGPEAIRPAPPYSSISTPASALLREKSPTIAPTGVPAAASSARARSILPRLAKSSIGGAEDATDRRHAATRPASSFGQARPQQGKTLFGEDPMSDKSLDEVILSYLSAELDEKK
jgi:hypothetical protein